jgi:uncharacterized cupredoxin-like copper-binding protein
MSFRFVSSLAIVSVLALAACSSSNGEPTASIQDSQSVVAAADWSHAQSIDVGLSSFAFTPTNLSLQHDQPYKIHLVNNSSDTHTFSSKDLFSAVAVQKVEKGGVTQPSLQDKSVSLAPNEQADLYLVAVKPGTYHIYCDEFMHDTMGMHGNVTIQ